MVTPRSVSRSAHDPHDVFPWNALVDLCAMEPLVACSQIQRKAALLFWYQAEVNNGGHFQYFMNNPEYPHGELLSVLKELGAEHSAAVFTSALRCFEGELPTWTDDPNDYLAQEGSSGMTSLDLEWGSQGDKEVTECLMKLLRTHENEFVRWLP